MNIIIGSFFECVYVMERYFCVWIGLEKNLIEDVVVVINNNRVVK